MRVHAALADQAEIGQPLQKRSTDLRAFPDEHQCLAIVQTLSELVDILYVIVEHRYVVAEQLVEAVQRAERVEVVVQDRNPHPQPPQCEPDPLITGFRPDNTDIVKDPHPRASTAQVC